MKKRNFNLKKKDIRNFILNKRVKNQEKILLFVFLKKCTIKAQNKLSTS